MEMLKWFPDNDRSPAAVGDSVFPAEVTDMIIDHLHDCPSILRCCALVCRDWNAASRYHLFYTVSFTPQRAAFSDLLAFIVSAPDICPYVKVLILSDYRNVSLKDVRAVLEPLSGLRSVKLNQLHISTPHWSEPMLEPAVGVLATLHISSCNVIQIDTPVLFLLLGLFSEVTTLHLAHARSDSIILAQPMNAFLTGGFPLSHFRVSNLVICAIPITALNLLFHRPYLPQLGASLRTLCIDGGFRSWVHVSKIGDLFAVVGPQLREVAIRLTSKQVAPPFVVNLNGAWHALNAHGGLQAADEAPPISPLTNGDTIEKWRALRLEQCTGLEVFKIYVGHTDFFMRHGSEGVFRTTVDLLTHLPSTVRQVRIGFSPEYFSPYNNAFERYKDFLVGLDWQALDSTLAAQRFRKLTVVLDVGLIKQICEEERCRELFESVMNALPGLVSRDMVELDFTGEKWWTQVRV